MRISDWSSDVCSSDLYEFSAAGACQCCGKLIVRAGMVENQRSRPRPQLKQRAVQNTRRAGAISSAGTDIDGAGASNTIGNIDAGTDVAGRDGRTACYGQLADAATPPDCARPVVFPDGLNPPHTYRALPSDQRHGGK